MRTSRFGSSSATTPPQYEHIDIGEDEPISTLKSGVWCLHKDGSPATILLVPVSDYGGCGITHRMRVQVATVPGPQGEKFARDFYAHLENAILNAKSYRGKVLSLEDSESYFGQSAGVKVHRFSAISRDQVILPQATLNLLDRNVIDFVHKRKGLGEYRMATKKGLLFYGPPGTGKTHTIRYLAANLDGHTTFLIAAEQVGQLGEYLTLARLFQPSIVVIEDVDLIARERTRMNNVEAEVMLNKLLNEMDGLREDCEILFVLTTNRPEELEPALAARPGRIDQAIEFPLPDLEGRRKLVQLYSRGLEVSPELVDDIAKRTEKVSASFIKELMRRAAQNHLETNGDDQLRNEDVMSALEEMLIRGGSLNLTLLGGAERIRDLMASE